MLGYQIDPEDVKLVERVNFIKTEFTDSVCNIYMNASMTYGVEEYFLVGKIFKDWKHQGNYTYIKGIEREYKSVKPVLNAIIKEYDTCGEMDRILIFAGLKKDIKETRMYKKLIKESELKEAENNSEPVGTPINEGIEQVNETLQTEKQDQSITETIISQPQTPSSNHNNSTLTELFNSHTLLKETDNVQIIGKIESHTSYISNETYDMITDIKILKDNNIIYEAYRIDFPLNCKDKISLVNYLDDIVLYINNSTLEPYWLNIQLDKLLKERKTIHFNIAVKQLKNTIKDQNRIKETQQREKEIEELKTNVITLANNKNMLVAIGSENIRLLKDMQQRQTSKDFIKTILNMDVNDKILQPYLIKNFELEDTSDMYYSDINKKLLLQAKEYLQTI